MDDILLGHDEIEAERKRACEAWYPESGTIPWAYWWQQWTLRAQVRKVATEIKNIVSPRPLPPLLNQADAEIWEKGYRVAMVDIQQALLRAAAEEVK